MAILCRARLQTISRLRTRGPRHDEALALLTLLAAASTAPATVWHYDIDDPNGSANAGDISCVTTSFDDVSEVFSWEYTITESAVGFSDAFWLVVSDGPNPKGVQNQLAILYGDLAANRVSAFQYNGANNQNSFMNPGQFIESFDGVLNVSTTATERTIGFSIDVTNINDYVPTPAPTGSEAWEGVRFDDQLGIWFHPSAGSTISYDANGEVDGYTFRRQGWYDTSNRTTTVVPAPAPLALLGLALMAMLGLRRSR